MIDSTIAPIARRTGPSKKEKDHSKICKFIKIGAAVTAIAIPIITCSIAYIVAFTAIKVTLINPKFTLVLKIVVPLAFGAGISLIEISLCICISCKNHQEKNVSPLIIEHEILEEDENKGLVEKEDEALPLGDQEEEPFTPTIHEKSEEVNKALVPKYSEADNKIIEQYGMELVETLGIDFVRKIPKVSAADLGISGKYQRSFIIDPIHPDLLEGDHIIRGMIYVHDKKQSAPFETYFIAIKIDILDEFHQYINTYVEIIFKSSLDYYSTPTNYVISKDNKQLRCLLPKKSFLMYTNDLLNLKKLINGEELEITRYKSRLKNLINADEIPTDKVKLFLRLVEKEIITEEYMERFEEIQRHSALISFKTVLISLKTVDKTIYCFSSIFIN